MWYAVLAVRLLLGAVFTFFGLNFYLKFMDMASPSLTTAASNFMSAVGPSGYMHAVKAFEVGGGILLLSGILVPLGIVFLTPVIVNIFFYDIFLMGKPGLSFALLPMAIFLFWAYRAYFLSVFTLHAKPAVSPREAGATAGRPAVGA
jgi:putative oxidoreductase